MAKVRVMAVFQGASLLPEDRFINTFHFADDDLPYLAVATELREAVRDFYDTTSSGGDTLGTRISPYVRREFQLLSYDLEAAPPRVPTELIGTLNTAAGGGLPEEVAVCITLQGAPPVTARRRGRLYIGPLCNGTNNIDSGTVTTPARPHMGDALALTVLIGTCANTLMAASALAGCPWSIRSTTPSENFVEIVGGYIDNAFDTQRRRGPDPTTRALWA